LKGENAVGLDRRNCEGERDIFKGLGVWGSTIAALSETFGDERCEYLNREEDVFYKKREENINQT
jgi:hypothetical protein